jgi:hypothetical protein
MRSRSLLGLHSSNVIVMITVSHPGIMVGLATVAVVAACRDRDAAPGRNLDP